MEKWEALLKFQNAIERVAYADEKIRHAPSNYASPETIAGHVAQWTEVRAASAQIAVDALGVLLA